MNYNTAPAEKYKPSVCYSENGDPQPRDCEMEQREISRIINQLSHTIETTSNITLEGILPSLRDVLPQTPSPSKTAPCEKYQEPLTLLGKRLYDLNIRLNEVNRVLSAIPCEIQL